MNISVKKAAFHRSFQTTNSVLTHLAHIDTHLTLYTTRIFKTKEIL